MKHINRSGTWASGNPRLYFRPKGQKGIALPDLPADHPEILRLAAQLLAEHEGRNPPATVRHPTGTIAAAIEAYRRSDWFLAMARSTQGVWDRSLTDMIARYGTARLVDLRTKHIRQDMARLKPHPANNRLKVWRSLCGWALEVGLIEDNPATAVRPRKTAPAQGATPWTRDDVTRFRAHWPVDTPQRLAFEVLHRSCAAMVDALKLGPGMPRDGWLTYQRQKSRSMACIPWSPETTPPWAEWTDDLERCLAAQPRHMTYIVAAHGGARSAKAASSWFSKACTAAGLTGRSAHGIRKHRAAVFKESGATSEQRMAILGHETLDEARAYSRSADLRRTISGTESSNSLDPSSNLRDEDQEKQGLR